MELPIDHFRLLGVSPSAQSEAVLRAFQLRLDRAPGNGFTHEVLLQRAELLRLSADLLTDESLRHEYEAALLGGASGLELSSTREVAGLILLWEADSAFEAFNLSKKALKPPQAPALGSGREADLTLIAALSCQSAAQQEQDQRHYQSAALLLKEGIQLMQRMGKLADQRQIMEEDLESLLPYRILDLVSRDLGDQDFHQEGLQLLDEFVRQRGGLEGKKSARLIGGLGQSDFVLFFQQIRKFLTVQEQLDQFFKWQKRGSSEAGFIGVMALVASGFSQRKPERLQQARKFLKSLDLPGLDKYPLLGCIELLLADVKQAEACFHSSSDEGLNNWLKSYPGETLAALCDYCRDWLKKDVLPGYRDVEAEPVDLEAWFADRDVQGFVENLENKGALGLAKSSFSFLSSFSTDKPQSDLISEEIDSNRALPMPGGVIDPLEERSDLSEESEKRSFIGRLLRPALGLPKFKKLRFKRSLEQPRRPLIGSVLLFVLVVIGGSFAWYEVRKNPLLEDSPELKPVLAKPDGVTTKSALLLENYKIEPLAVKEPDEEQVKTLLEAWLIGKAAILSGEKNDILSIVARDALVKRVIEERVKDISKKETQIVDASITTFKVVSQTSKRIEVKVRLKYLDKRLNPSGEIISETLIPSLKVTYVLGREKDLWQLVDYISGS